MAPNDICSLAAEEKLLPDYRSSSDDDDLDTLLPSTAAHRYNQSCRLRPFLALILHGCSILTCLVLLICASSIYNASRRSCLEQTHAWSPMLDAIVNDYQDVFWNGSLWYQSPYKGPPTPEVNKAWHDLMEYGLISVSADDIQRAGYSLNSVQFPPSVGGGYLATATGTHHIHCLHYIWQDHHMASFPSVQATKAAVPEMYERHYEHCVDYIRQGVMCNYDMTMIAFNWVKTHDSPTPNGNTNHKCVDWEKTQSWLKDRVVQMPDGFVWKQPEGADSLNYNP